MSTHSVQIVLVDDSSAEANIAPITKVRPDTTFYAQCVYSEYPICEYSEYPFVSTPSTHM